MRARRSSRLPRARTSSLEHAGNGHASKHRRSTAGDSFRTTVPLDRSPRLLLTVEEAAERIGICRSSMFELIQQGDVRTVKVGRLRRVIPAALEDFITRLSDNEEPVGKPGRVWRRLFRAPIARHACGHPRSRLLLPPVRLEDLGHPGAPVERTHESFHVLISWPQGPQRMQALPAAVGIAADVTVRRGAVSRTDRRVWRAYPTAGGHRPLTVSLSDMAVDRPGRSVRVTMMCAAANGRVWRAGVSGSNGNSRHPTADSR